MVEPSISDNHALKLAEASLGDPLRLRESIDVAIGILGNLLVPMVTMGTSAFLDAPRRF